MASLSDRLAQAAATMSFGQRCHELHKRPGKTKRWRTANPPLPEEKLAAQEWASDFERRWSLADAVDDDIRSKCW